MALNKTDAELKKRNQTLLDFNYNDKNIMAILNANLASISFTGITVSHHIMTAIFYLFGIL